MLRGAPFVLRHLFVALVVLPLAASCRGTQHHIAPANVCSIGVRSRAGTALAKLIWLVNRGGLFVGVTRTKPADEGQNPRREAEGVHRVRGDAHTPPRLLRDR